MVCASFLPSWDLVDATLACPVCHVLECLSVSYTAQQGSILDFLGPHKSLRVEFMTPSESSASSAKGLAMISKENLPRNTASSA